jgi:chromosome segregation ATPase
MLFDPPTQSHIYSRKSLVMVNPRNANTTTSRMDPADGPQGQPSAVANYRGEDERRREDARFVALQNQIDELRMLNRELVSRQSRDEELIKQNESLSAQLRLALEQLRQESQQTAQARALDENRTRQVVQELEARIDDGIRPVRSLQAHVSELLEASRRKVDDAGQAEKRIDELVTIVEHLSAVSDRNAALAHGLRDNIDGVRAEVDGFRRDIIRAEDAIKIVDQEGRRRTTDVKEVAESYSARLDELRADLGHLYDSFEDQRRGLVHVDPTLDELRAGELSLRQDLGRLQAQVTERHDILIDMQDDARQETDARFDQLRQTIEERLDRLNERLEEANEQFRETTYKLSDLNAALEELRQVDAALHRDIWYLHEQRVRVRLEQIQEELDVATAQRRDADSEAQAGLGNRFRRRRQGGEQAEF